MPITYVIDGTSRIVVTTCVGAITFEEMRDVATEMRDDPEFKSNFGQLIDLTQVSQLNLTFRELTTFKESFDPFSNESQRAVVALADAAYGIGRMYGGILDRPSFAVFRTMNEARQWLKLK